MTQRQQSIVIALQEVLSSRAGKATMLASINDEVLSLSARGRPKQVSELVPPEEWFEQGQLEWLTQDGALLGLIWSPTENELEQTTLELLTWLLAAARSNESKRAVNVLITQLPEGAAWLDGQLRFQQVSRQFLELHGLQASQVIGRPFLEVFPKRLTTAQLLEQGLLGLPQELEQEWVSSGEQQLWLRSRVRPYFSDEGAGVLWTVQDIGNELALQAGMTAALNATQQPTALLDARGQLIQAAQSLQQLSLQYAQDTLKRGEHVSEWALWGAGQLGAGQLGAGQLSRAAWTALLRQAPLSPAPPLQRTLKLGEQRLEISLSQANLSEGELPGGPPTAEQPIYLLEFGLQGYSPERANLFNTFIQVSPQPLLLLGPEEEKRERPLLMLSQTALQLLGFEPKHFRPGQSVDAFLKQQQIFLTRPDGSPVTLTQLCLQALTAQASTQFKAAQEAPEAIHAVLSRPDGSRRHIELSATALRPSEALQGKDPKKGKGNELEIQKGTPSPLSVYLEDVTSKRHLEERLQHNARHDALTGLPNWQGLSKLWIEQAEQAEAQRSVKASKGKKAVPNAPFCLMIIAIDDFTALQATLGRMTSDHLLIQMAARLHQWRKEGRAARLDGERFALLLPFQESGQLPKLARDLQQSLSQPMRAGGQEIHLSVSIGVSCTAQGQRLDTHLEEAQSALHAAQSAATGRGRIELYSPAVRQQDAELLNLEQEMHRVLPAQFAALLQPIISLESGRVQGVELLLRWNHPVRGNINPRTFLPFLARNDLMPVLGEWLLDEAQTLRRRWATRYPHLRLHLNVSGEELTSETYLSHLYALIEQGGHLSLEISAQGLLQEQDRQSKVLPALRAAGCELYIDEFGNGSANIKTLEQFALSGVKLHPSFVANLQEGSKQLSVLEGTVELMRRLNLQLIAVGVEHAAQAQLLHKAGCHAAQGYLYLPPCPLEEFEGWMETQVVEP